MVKFQNKIISIFDKKTSIRLTEIEWNILDNICIKENIRRKNLLEMIYSHRCKNISFTPYIRLFTLIYLYKHTHLLEQRYTDIEKILNNLE